MGKTPPLGPKPFFAPKKSSQKGPAPPIPARHYGRGTEPKTRFFEQALYAAQIGLRNRGVSIEESWLIMDAIAEDPFRHDVKIAVRQGSNGDWVHQQWRAWKERDSEGGVF